MAFSKLNVLLSLNNSQFTAGLAKSQAQTERFGKSMNGVGKSIQAAFGVAGATAVLLARGYSMLSKVMPVRWPNLTGIFTMPQ